MGVVFQMCNCSSEQAIVPNSISMVENDLNNLYNPNIKTNKKISNNNIENIKKKKKTSNGVINNEQSNEAETYKNISSNGAAVLTPKQKREPIYSKKITKNKKSVKDSDKKSSKGKSKKSQENISEDEEDFENVNISETVLSELIISDKIKPIQKDKKKKIKGRNIISIVIIGYNEVGKSSFCFRFIDNKFEDFYIPSICNENFCKMMIYNDHNYKLNFTVILGGKKIQKQDNLMSTADFFLIIYDITKIRSFNQINIYLKQLKKNLFSYDKEGKNLNFFLIGNKSDLEGERKVGLEFVNKCIQKYKINHFEISAKTGKNVSNIISSILQIFDKLAYSSK
jgi:GTPase SAR1 family protein